MASFDDFVAPQAPTEPKLSTRDKNLVQGVRSSLTPEVLAGQHQADLDPANIAELEAEIARTKDPKARNILVTEHNRIKGEISKLNPTGSFADFTPHKNIQVDETDLSSALKSLKGISVKEFFENNLITNLGASIYRAYKNTKQGYAETTEGTFKLGPELETKWHQIPIELAKAAKEKPMTTAVDFFKGILYEPELLAIGGVGGAIRPARMAKSAAAGGLITGGSEASRQLAQKDTLSGQEIVGQTATGAAIGAGFGAFGGKPRGKPTEPQPRPSRQAGETDPEMLAWLSAGAGLTVAGQMIYSEHERSGRSILDIIKNPRGPLPAPKEPPEETEPQPTEKGTFLAKRDIPNWLIGTGLIVGAVKAKGGFWHPEAPERLSSAIKRNLMPEQVRRSGAEMHVWQDETGIKVDRMVRNYLNRYAGTKEDPLKDVEIPFGEGTARWEEITDNIVKKDIKEMFGTKGIEKVPAGEEIWHLHGAQIGNIPKETQRRMGEALTSYLSHVGDYLRQNVPPEKLQQYDLVRAVKETAKNDERVAREMEKAQAASTKDMPVYKSYPDGFKWVELKLPEKLTEEQAKNIKDVGEGKSVRADPDNPHRYVAENGTGKAIRNTYTDDIASGATPEEAHLAGQLAQEGNQMGHCVGGYCAGVAAGESRIFSLRDAKGKSHVTVEVAPPRGKYLQEGVLTPSTTENITQIKGKQNRAPSKEYLPYVQDFVRGGKWSEVGDLGNTGLFDLQAPQHAADYPVEKMRADFPGQRYLSYDEGKTWLEEHGYYKGQGPSTPPRERGSITVEDAAKLAALGLGAAAGAYLDDKHPYFGMAVGAG